MVFLYSHDLCILWIVSLSNGIFILTFKQILSIKNVKKTTGISGTDIGVSKEDKLSDVIHKVPSTNQLSIVATWCCYVFPIFSKDMMLINVGNDQAV